MADTPKILYVVDDEEDICTFLFIWFKQKGYNVKTFSNSKDLYVGYEKQIPDLILLDVNLKGEDGRVICKQLKSQMSFAAPVLLFSANPANGDNYKQYEASDFINKPFSLKEISNLVASYISC